MIPNEIVNLDKLPMTANKKIDKKALSEREFSSMKDVVPAKTKIEKTILSIWSDILLIDEEKICKRRIKITD